MFDDMTLELPNFSGLFKKKKKNCVGVDIGSSSIKVVELERKGSKIVLKNYAITNVNKKGLIKPGSSKIIGVEVGEIVERIFEDIGIKSRAINVAVPSFASLVTTIELPPVSEKEIDKIIQVEAPKYIPIPLDEVVYGWEIVDDKPQGIDSDIKLSKNVKRSTMKVALVSIMKSISQEYEKVFRKKGFVIESLEVDTFALKRSFNGDKGNYLMVDVGSNITNISVIINKSIVVNRSIDVGGDRLTELLSQSMGVSIERADKIKINQGLKVDSQDIQKQVISPLLKNITDEINKAIEVFTENYVDLEMGSLVLTGGFSQMKGLKEFIARETKMKVVEGNPWAKISYPKKLKENLFSLNPYFGTAVGLALRGLVGDDNNK